MKSRFRPPYLGAAYYPEDWPLEQVDADIEAMLRAGMNVMRIGEFAWARMEPEAGCYDFDWMHQVVDKLGQAGIATILGTPTATPPVWLTGRYPEVLQVFDVAEGVRAQHGGRRHACPNHPVYRDHAARIVTRMAEEFGRDPNVIGWQIDNEVYPYKRGCCCPVCITEFRRWLRARYGTIDALNRAWGLNIFSLMYQDFDQIPFPRSDTWHHPSLLSAWMAFQSDSYVGYVGVQADILHRLTRDQPVGTDMMPFGGLSHYETTRGLDVVQFNHYNSMDNLWEVLFWFDYMRPLKARPFWNTETSTCWSGSTVASGYREPGFNRVNSWLPLALGGEANLYWLWRAHWSGHEVMHGSVLSSCGRPMHVFEEVQEVARGFSAAGGFLTGTRPTPSGLALHFSTPAWSMFESQPLAGGFKYLRQMLDSAYRPLLQSHLRPDIIDPAVALESYRVVFSPYLPALDESGLRDRLRSWIEAGGTWIAGPFTDIRTEDATKYTQAPFGSLESWAGVYGKYELPADPHPFKLRWSDGTESNGSVWQCGFELRGAEALATYEEGPLRGLAAVTRRRMGRGWVIVLGTMPSPGDMARQMVQWAGEAGIAPAAEASPDVLVVPRSGSAGEGMVVIEHGHRAGRLSLPRPMTDLITGRSYEGEVELDPYRVLVLKA